MQLNFIPSDEQGARCDAAMRKDLGDTLAYLKIRASTLFEGEPGVREASRLAAVIRDLHAGKRLHPAVFGHFSYWVHALLSNHYRQQSLYDLLEAASLGERYPAIVNLDAPALAKSRSVVTELMGAGTDQALELAPASTPACNRTINAIHDAFAIADACASSLADEMRHLITQIILVTSESNNGVVFDGGSSYMLWGAMMVNASPERSSIEMLEMLAHESAHLLLYSAAHQEPLVENPESERYPSPLRHDKRPMDGIFHATWVLARMAWTMHQVAQCPNLSQLEQDEALTALRQSLAHFDAGFRTVQEHGRLTPTGKHLMDGAASWVASLADERPG